MRISVQQLQSQTTPSKKFTRKINESSSFTHHPNNLHTTTVYLLQPPRSLSSSDHRPWIIFPDTTTTTTASTTVVLRHPLTSKPFLCNLPRNFNLRNLHPSAIAESYCFSAADKLLVVGTTSFNSRNNVDVRNCSLFALYDGGELRCCPRAAAYTAEESPWVRLTTCGKKFDDIAAFSGKIYAVDRYGMLILINNYKTNRKITIGKTLISDYVASNSRRFGWRNRLVVDGGSLYLVVRDEEKLFSVYMLKWRAKKRGKTCFWKEVREFDVNNKVLFMARDYYFFRNATRMFPGREYRNCIVFSEAAFPQYVKDCWKFTESDNVRRCEDDIAVFCLGDEKFVREGEGEGEKSGFPKIDWSPPDWILNVSSFTEDEFSMHSVSESSVQSEREPDEGEGLDSDSGDKNDEEVQSDLKDINSKEEREQDEMETEFSSQDQDQGGVGSDLESKDQEDKKMQCDLNSQEKEDEEMHSIEAIIEVNAPLQKDPVTPFRSAVEEDVMRTLLRMNSVKDAIEEEISGKNISYVIPKASTSATTERHECNSATTKFEGLDIRSDLVPTLQKIWRKHGNVTTDSIVRSSDIIARALESLATMVQILEDNLAQSLSDSQAEYLSSTLSDLKCLRFKVYWLVSFVENALKVHKSKSLVESLNNLSQLSSQVEERRTILLDEVAKLNEEEKKLKEEMAKVSKTIPFSGKVNFDEPLGVGLI